MPPRKGRDVKTKDKSCFVIAPLSEGGSPVRSRSDKVFRHIIKPAVEQCGYEPLRSDIEPTPGMIGQQIINHLLKDDLVIADLTGQNANVFYELAIRHMARKPVVQIIEKGEPLPFDITQSRTIFLDHTDLDSVETCREEIVKQITELEHDPELIENPVSQALRIESLKESSDPRERREGEMIARLDRLSALVEMLLLKQHLHSLRGTSLAGMRPGIDGAFDEEQMVGEASSFGQNIATPVDDIIGTSATLDEAITRFERMRDASIPADKERDTSPCPNDEVS